MDTPWQVYAASGIDPAPITAWLLLVCALLTIIGGVCAFIAFGWRYIALPQIKDAIEVRVDLSEKASHASFRNVHTRIDGHLAHHPD